MINAEILEQLKTTEEELVKILDSDVREIFATMVGIDITASTRTDTSTNFKACLSAMVGFAGSYSGMISINTPQKLAVTFASKMLGMEIHECDADVHDSLGEIANMIGGSFKHHFVKDGHEVRLSTPSVISGGEYSMTVGSLPDTLTILLECGEDHFTVSVYLEI